MGNLTSTCAAKTDLGTFLWQKVKTNSNSCSAMSAFCAQLCLLVDISASQLRIQPSVHFYHWSGNDKTKPFVRWSLALSWVTFLSLKLDTAKNFSQETRLAVFLWDWIWKKDCTVLHWRWDWKLNLSIVKMGGEVKGEISTSQYHEIWRQRGPF